MEIKLRLEITHSLDPKLQCLVEEGINLLRTIMPTLQEIQAAQQANSDATAALAGAVTDTVVPEIAALAKKVDALIAQANAGGSIDPAALQPIVDGMNASTGKLTDLATALKAAADAAAPEAA